MDDFGGFGGWDNSWDSGYSLFGGDTPDLGTSWDFGGSDLMSQFQPGGLDLGFSPTLDTGNLYQGGGLGVPGGIPAAPFGGIPQPAPQVAPAPPQAAPQAAGAGNSLLAALLSPQGLLGVGGGLAGLIGTLSAGGQTGKQTRTVQPTTQQQAQMNQGYQALGQFANAQTPLQQQQTSLLTALSNGQGLPPGYAQLVEQAFQPQLGDLYTQAANAGRARGFHDAPATSPVGSAVLGPGLANLQGQIAAEKLKMMMGLPGLYNQPIATQGNFAQNYLSAAQNPNLMNSQVTGSVPMGPQIGTVVGAGLQGIGQAIGQSQAAQQQAQFQNQLMKQLQQTNSGAGQYPGYGQ